MKKITFDFENVGGLMECYAIPLSSFLRIREDYIGQKKVLEVQNRDDIISIPVYMDSSFSFSEKHDWDEGGDSWQPSIEGIIPKDCLENAADIETLERGEWMLLSRDYNGTVRLSGTEDFLLKFTDTKNTGTAATDINQISFTFSGKQDCPSLILDQDDLEDI
jgi:hypothetical protein